MPSIVVIRHRAGGSAAQAHAGQRKPLSLCAFYQRCGSLFSGILLKLSALAADNTSVLSHMGRKHKNPPCGAGVKEQSS
jgi:hypothetical protein